MDVVDDVPDIQDFTSTVAELHTESVPPNGKYGFPTPTCMGQMAHFTIWTDSWENFFTISIERLIRRIEESQGPDAVFRKMFQQTMEKVVPRLLRPLETGGRQIKPSLVYGDLYSGNVSVSVELVSRYCMTRGAVSWGLH